MQPLYLSVEGIFNKECQKYDFTPQTTNLVAISNDNMPELITLFSLGLFGGGQKEGRLELKYEYNNEEYTVRRDFSAGTAELSCKDGILVCKGRANVDKQIISHIKMDASCFEKLAFIDREKIYAGFMLPSKEREAFVKEFSERLLSGKDDINIIENRLKEKYQKTSLQLEMIEDVDPKTLAIMKDDIKETKVIRQEAKTELEELTRSIIKGEEALKAKKSLEEEKKALDNAMNMQPVIDELAALLEKSNQAEVLSLLIKRKEVITERDIELKQQITALEEEVSKLDENIEKGEKSSLNIEKTLIHCLERIKELRNTLYNNIEGLKTDEELQNKIRKVIDKYYEKDDQELIVLSQRLAEVDREIAATQKSYADIEQRLNEIKREPDVKKAIREGAVLETEIKKLNEIISAAKNSMEFESKRLDIVKTEIENADKNLKEEEARLAKIQEENREVVADMEAAIRKAEDKKKYLYKNHILITAQQDEIQRIEEKIAENQDGIKQYEENLQALQTAEKSLKEHMDNLMENKEILKKNIIDTRVALTYIRQNQELEYGEKCPICSSLVTQKNEDDASKAQALEDKLDKLTEQLNKANSYEKEYKQKLENINKRYGELDARIKISVLYIQSLKDSILSKSNIIMNIYNENDITKSYELTDKMNKAMDEYEALVNLSEQIKQLKDNIAADKAKIAFYEKEKKTLEEELLPNSLQRYTLASESLEQAQTQYKKLEAPLGGVKAGERFEELTLTEKETFTLEEDLTKKRWRLDELMEEKEGIDKLIFTIKGRQKTIKVGDEEYDYTKLVIKTTGGFIDELIEEIKKSEQEAEDIKVEFSAVKKVLERYKKERREKAHQMDALKAKLASDEEVLENIMTDYEGKISALNAKNAFELQKLTLSEERKDSVKEEIASHNQSIAIYKSNIERLENIVQNYKEELENLEENKELYKNLNTKIEELGQKISDVYAHRKELKSRAKQVLALKDKLAKYNGKIDFLKEVSHMLEKNGDIPQFIVKLASKKLYSLTKGKYNLDIADGKLVLINNNNGGKVVERNSYKREDKTLISFVLGTALHRTIIDMIGGENFMLIFPLKEKEATKDIAYALTNYAKKRALMVVTENQSELENLKKVI